MFKNLKLKPAKSHDTKKLTELFDEITNGLDQKLTEKDVKNFIEKKRVFVLKKRKNVKAAFIYTIIGITGIFSIMWLKRLAVNKDERGNGLGTYLLNKIKSFSNKKGFNMGILHGIKKARNFYKKNNLNNFLVWFWWK